jgi:serine/threonine-protein kinase
VNGHALIRFLHTNTRSPIYAGISSHSRPPFAVKSVSVGHGISSLLLQREIRFHYWITHPNLVELDSVFHCSQTQTAYLFFEWASYGSLSDFIGCHLSEEIIASIFTQIFRAIECLHNHGIVTHNVQPSNILLFERGVAKLSNLKMSQNLEIVDAVGGSSDYEAPESVLECQDETVIDPVKEEVWSLGVSFTRRFLDGYLTKSGVIVRQ